MFGNVNIVSLGKPNQWKTLSSSDWTAMAVSAADETLFGGAVAMTGRDDRYLIMVTNTHETDAATVTVKAGNAFQSTGKDVTLSLAAGATAYIQVESGRFKCATTDAPMSANITGGNAMDKVFLTASAATVKACVLYLAL